VTRVLVVEDEESFSDALSYMLRREGFEVAVCPTGPDAIEAFDRHGADLVLLDLMLPGLPGSEVCRTLRERSNVPVIMLTAKDSEIDKVVSGPRSRPTRATRATSSRSAGSATSSSPATERRRCLAASAWRMESARRTSAWASALRRGPGWQPA
jgi:CheY-like chemotaxis protein